MVGGAAVGESKVLFGVLERRVESECTLVVEYGFTHLALMIVCTAEVVVKLG